MVKALHRAGIEVILDVVYNHTAEGNHLGPMLVVPRHRQRSRTTGSSPTTRASTWTTRAPATASTRSHPTRAAADHGLAALLRRPNCHVDGFRFDLASALAREFHEVDRLAAFFDIIHQDPILSQVKLIAEPWDVGEGGYQVGNFPVLWTEWNGIYRDVDARLLARAGAPRRLRVPLHRLGRPLREGRPAAVRRRSTSSPPTTASRSRDLVSYNDKHNEANLEDNRDGTDDNRSWNCGAEGPTDDPGDQRAARAPAAELPRDAPALAGRADAGRRRRARPHAGRQQQRLLPGQRDLVGRLGRSTSGSERLLEFTKRLIELRREHPVFRRATLPRRRAASARRCPTRGGSGPTG